MREGVRERGRERVCVCERGGEREREREGVCVTEGGGEERGREGV